MKNSITNSLIPNNEFETNNENKEEQQQEEETKKIIANKILIQSINNCNK